MLLRTVFAFAFLLSHMETSFCIALIVAYDNVTLDPLLTEEDTATVPFDVHSVSIETPAVSLFTPNDTDITNRTDDDSGENMVVKRSGHITEDLYNDFRTAVWFVVVPPITLIGIIANVSGLCFLLYSNKLKQTFYIFLFALMFVDIVYLVITLLSNILIIMEKYDKPFVDLLRCHSGMNLRAAQSLTYSSCGHLITIMSFERLVNILYPLKIKTFNRKYAIITILFTFALNIALLSTAFMILEPKETIDPVTKEVKCETVLTSWGKGFRKFQKYYVVIMLVVARFVPGTATLFANVLISIYLTRHRSQRAALFANKTTRGEQYEQHKTTLTLIILSVALLLSFVPSAMTTILSSFYPELYGEDGTLYFTYRFVQDLGYCLRVISAANDFLLYIWLCRSSRVAFLNIVKEKCCFCCRDKGQVNMSQGSRGTTPDVEESFENRAFEETRGFDRLN